MNHHDFYIYFVDLKMKNEQDVEHEVKDFYIEKEKGSRGNV